MIDDWICPILQTLMRDPVVAQDGYTYERAAIEEWFRSCGDAKLVSPMTGLELQSRILFANRALRNTIQEHIKSHPESAALLTPPDEIRRIVAKYANKGGPTGATGAAPIAVEAVSLQTTVTGLQALNISYNAMEKNTNDQLVPCNILLVGCRYFYHNFVDSLGILDAERTKMVKQPINAKAESLTCAGTLVTREGGKFIASGSSNGVLQFHELQGDTIVNINLQRELIFAHNSSINAVSSWNSPSFPVFLSCGRDKLVKMWKATTARPVSTFGGASSNSPTRASPMGSDVSHLRTEKSRRTKWFGSSSASSESQRGMENNEASEDGYRWEFRCESEFTCHTDFVNCVQVEDFSGKAVSVGEDWQTSILDLPTSSVVATYEHHSYPVRCCAWASSGELDVNGFSGPQHNVFASGGDDEKVVVFDIRDRRKIVELRCGASVVCCCWGDNKSSTGGELPWLAAGGGTPTDSFMGSTDCLGGYIRIWDPRMWKSVGDCCRKSQGEMSQYKNAEGDTNKLRDAHSSVVTRISPYRAADGRLMLVSCGEDSAVRFWALPYGPGGMTHPLLFDEFENDDNIFNLFVKVFP